MKNKNNILDVLAKLVEINPNLPLHKHIIFWIPIAVFVLPALILSFPSWCLCWPSQEDYEALLKVQGFPVFIASLAIPFTVAINRFHSSSQRAESNRLSQQNMAFNHYFDHRSHFYKHLDDMLLDEPFRHFITIDNPNHLYKIVFPLNKIDHQDMSAPKDDVTKVISDKVSSVYDHINPKVIKYFDGKLMFKHGEAAKFVEEIGEPFGITFKLSIIKYVDRTGGIEAKSVMALCFYGILEVINEAGRFSHKGFGGWTSALALDSLLKSTRKSNELKQFNDFLERCLTAEYDASLPQVENTPLKKS